MVLGIHQILKKLSCTISSRIGSGQYGESPYLNIPFYQTPMDPSDTKEEIQNGAPAMTNEPGLSQRGDPKNLMQFQGERPLVDSLVNDSSVPVTNTVMNEEKTNAQGEPNNNTTTPEGLNDNRDTIGFDPGLWTDPWVDADPSGWNNPNDNR